MTIEDRVERLERLVLTLARGLQHPELAGNWGHPTIPAMLGTIIWELENTL